MSKIGQLKKIATDRRWWSFYMQRQFLNPKTRNRIADRVARSRPKAALHDNAIAQVGVDNLKKTGIHSLGELLTSDQCRELHDYFTSKEVRDPYRPSLPNFLPLSGNRHPEGHIAHHGPRDIVNAPYLFDLANDPRILDIVGVFLGCKPSIGYMATWWSYPTNSGAQQAEIFHRDVDDWRFVKLFIYLTKVGPENGPHKYVIRSTSKSLLTKIHRYEDKEVATVFGEENILTMTSGAGEGFLEDTFGIHKGQPVQEGHRLLFQVVYTLNALPYAPPSPVADTAGSRPYDTWTNRVYINSK